MAVEHPPVPTALWETEGKEPQEAEQSGVCWTCSGAESPLDLQALLPLGQRGAGRVGVSVAGQEMGQGIACTNSPLEGSSTCSRARGGDPV